jgi:type I restriction-modification system DNA methylase subunit
VLDLEKLTPTEMNILHKLDNNIHSKCDISRSKLDDIKHIEDLGLVYTTQTKDHSCYHVRLTDYGMEVLENTDIPVGHFANGGSTADCGCNHKYDLGGGVDVAEPPTQFKYFKGINAKYKNQFEINKAIEELVDSVPAEKITPEEKAFIGYFSGYGGLEKYGATGKGLLYEYFTPSEIAKKMWGLAYKYGFKGGHVLEPSCGIGEFIKYAPEQSMVTGYEINETSAKICRVLFPQSNIQSKYFETLFIKNNNTIKDKVQGLKKYQLIIGNPPYGSMGGIYAGMGEKSYTNANNYIEYFISRGLDLLEKDGLLIYIIGTEVSAGGTPFLAQPMNPVKKLILQKAELVDAYRLPNGLFETTDVLTDIVVFKKK